MNVRNIKEYMKVLYYLDKILKISEKPMVNFGN